MNKGLRFVTAAGVGAGLMYFFDPDRGKRRRALVRDKVKHAARVTSDATGKTGRDLRNHVLGAYAQVGSLFQCSGVSDSVLEARVRSKLGRVVSHPRAIEVKSVDGEVILTGPILSAEEHPLLDAVIGIRGVKNIQNSLELHEESGDIPALQGGQQPRHGAAKIA